ncbi:YggS family pyridoxal phosphate-dependent enzyme [Leadbettera azotonutricia]|uniref:Pyridoxal phosphate homeostasis protein n=1 Tax=Leadbettera azotonutricia (strain ATCC BAA-888 / DSM 13862 / ZAS-9) TaxID=545695 RepID=F5YAC3_LEAAZ|nr:YggS family pyridoxal phosphate-dependent enzyme [Leadbettera azotonutricia]AEF80916.1 pyridoxal phosphate enzyme, YggS family [Leadbettera azotonutricia ZAS-9]
MDDTAKGVAQGIARIEERIAAACLRSGRKREEVLLMGVSKFHPIEKVEEAWKAGLRLFGENRVQEGIEKFSGFYGKGVDTKIHLIGSLQTNKARTAAFFFDCIQSVDRISLIEKLGEICVERDSPLDVLLEYHTGEESKMGFSGLDNLLKGAEKSLSYKGLNLRGLMTMAPFTDDEKIIRASFTRLREARDTLEKQFHKKLPCLSMGMSGDFELAIEEGSTLVRIGTAIFGERPK